MMPWMLLPNALAVEVIKTEPFVCLCVWVCESCVLHHFVGTGLRCAPLTTCAVHHGAQGGPMSVRSGGLPDTKCWPMV